MRRNLYPRFWRTLTIKDNFSNFNLELNEYVAGSATCKISSWKREIRDSPSETALSLENKTVSFCFYLFYHCECRSVLKNKLTKHWPVRQLSWEILTPDFSICLGSLNPDLTPLGKEKTRFSNNKVNTYFSTPFRRLLFLMFFSCSLSIHVNPLYFMEPISTH